MYTLETACKAAKVNERALREKIADGGLTRINGQVYVTGDAVSAAFPDADLPEVPDYSTVAGERERLSLPSLAAQVAELCGRVDALEKRGKPPVSEVAANKLKK
jgi:hypothetical protein